MTLIQALSAAAAPLLPGQRQRQRPTRQAPNHGKVWSLGWSTEQLRTQLQQLHLEADQTRAKSDNARLRLMRLTEAAENLRRQAAKEIGAGNEDQARDLLLQKRRVMQALDKSKTRIQFLDQLSAKLNEVISVKEAKLIGNVASDLEIGEEDASSPIRIISPSEGMEENLNTQVLESDCTKLNGVQEVEFQKGQHENVVDCQSDRIHTFKKVSSYKGFLENLDQQFYEIEVELITILRLSAIVMGNDQKQKNPKVQQITEILDDVRGIRARITSIMKATTYDS